MSTATLSTRFSQTFPRRIRLPRGLIFGAILLCALLAFELFNYSTTEFALHDLLGDLSFIGITWSTILALAFCGIDFAGIARLFTIGQDKSPVGNVWYLFAAWLLAATMNAMLTWWGVSIAILERQTQGSVLVDHQNSLESGASLCSRAGLADPRTDDRHILGLRRQVVQPGRKSAFHQCAAPASQRCPTWPTGCSWRFPSNHLTAAIPEPTPAALQTGKRRRDQSD